MPRAFEDSVVVITGASSGIGRAASLRLARRRCSLGLCARSEAPLERLAAECEELGAEVWSASVDVSDEAAVEEFAAAVAERFGALDVWVNNAAVMAYGEFLEIPSDVFRQIIETNLMGQVHGSRSALRRFKAQGFGTLINMSSVWGRVSSPEVAPYAVSKNAVRALSECLRGELVNHPDIHVTTMVPQAIDSPIFEHAGNYTGRAVRPIPPILAPDEVAKGIEACAENPQEEVNYGRSGRALEMLYAVAPGAYRRLTHGAFIRGSLSNRRIADAAGNVLSSSGPYEIEGRWRAEQRPTLRRAFLDAAIGLLLGPARSARR